jgi:hypothetical protein
MYAHMLPYAALCMTTLLQYQPYCTFHIKAFFWCHFCSHDRFWWDQLAFRSLCLTRLIYTGLFLAGPVGLHKQKEMQDTHIIGSLDTIA